MAITISCRCKSRFQVEDHMAGKLVQCPKCGESLMVLRSEEPATAKDAANEEDGDYSLAPAEPVAERKPFCPTCGAEMASGAVLCVQCGYHLLLRKQIGE